MKFTMLRATVIGALVLGLAACGGKAMFDVGGTVEGLKYPGLILTNGGTELAVAADATTFKFPNSIEYGTTYNVKIKESGTPVVQSQPAHQTCQVYNGADTAGRQAAINITVLCVTNATALGGTVTGLTADGLVLINGSSDTIPVAKDATTWAFANPVKYGSSYGVTILSQPTGLVCKLVNGVGEMGDLPVTNVNISCAPGIG